MLEWKKILVATDFSASARVALRSALALAEQVGGTVEVVHVVEPLPPRYRVLLGSLGALARPPQYLERAEIHLERLLGRVPSARVAVEGTVRMGKPWREILQAARELEADLVCLGNSGRSAIERLLLGSTAENVVRRSPFPVLVTRRRPLGDLDRVLVPIDFSEGSARALQFAAKRLPPAVRFDALYVVPPPPPIPDFYTYTTDREPLERELRSFLDRAGLGRAHGDVRLFEDPAFTILKGAQRMRADLILIATHGRRGLGRFLFGSVAEKVVRHADRPVLVLPGPGAGGPERQPVGGFKRARPAPGPPRRRAAHTPSERSEGKHRQSRRARVQATRRGVRGGTGKSR